MDKKDIQELLENQTKQIEKRLENQTKAVSLEIEKRFSAQSLEVDKKLTNQTKDLEQRIDKQSKDLEQRMDKQSKDLEQRMDKQSKSIQLQIEDQTKEIMRHQKMLLEEFDSRLKVVAEVQVEHTEKFIIIGEKLDAVMEMSAENNKNIREMKISLERKVDISDHELLARRTTMIEQKIGI